ncbi:Tab2 family RNA-binding protein [Synechococcus sp. PCC 7336]|uniref:Tab2 family RNA-binding protein n=1 Tax=Synechococcus sp. PCC 7336 TaxID=195250 RepID=UPI00034C49CA|nr:Tab2 family RNA-binding protein [Synechococcus sp. PCC 7336]
MALQYSRLRKVGPVWQVDFYRCPLKDKAGKVLWLLLACTSDRALELVAFCPQDRANSAWVAQQFEQWFQVHCTPQRIKVFRPKSFSLLSAACQSLNIPIEASRHTPALKHRLQLQDQLYPSLEGYTGEAYDPLELDPPPPQPLPQDLQGTRWQLASLSRPDLQAFANRSIPIANLKLSLSLNRLREDVQIPGAIFYGEKQSLQLARWFDDASPVSLHLIFGNPNGLVLEAGLADRWIVATFDDRTVQNAAVKFEQRKSDSAGLHFLLVLPDESGVTVTGLWLLRAEV